MKYTSKLRNMKKFLLLCLVLFGCAAMAPVADERDSASRFGVLDFLSWNHEWNAYHYDEKKIRQAAVLMKEAGIGFVRMDIAWSDVEPKQDEWVWTKYDRILDILSENGIRVVCTLGYNPLYQMKDWYDAPDPVRYANYAQHVVQRYKTRIKYWEIWNEPNHENYWVPQDGLVSYSQLLKKVYPVIKSEDPTAMVLVGGLTAKYWEEIKTLYGLGAGKSFDIVNIHPFANPLDRNPWNGIRAQYQALRQIMSDNGDVSKPVWVTEIGCPGVKPGVKRNEWWLGRNTTEKEQSRWVETVYKEMLQWPDLDKVFWAFFRDTPDHFFSGVDNFGLIREDFSKKPSYETYKKLAKN